MTSTAYERQRLAWLACYAESHRLFREQRKHVRPKKRRPRREIEVRDGVVWIECVRCEQMKPAEQFRPVHVSLARRSRTGLLSWCRQCENAVRMERKRERRMEPGA